MRQLVESFWKLPDPGIPGRAAGMYQARDQINQEPSAVPGRAAR